MDDSKRSEIEDELKWVEDNIPASGDANYLGTGDGYDEDYARDRPRSKIPSVNSGKEKQFSSYSQLFVFFVIMVLILNLALWLSGTNEDQEVPNTDRGFIRYVPDRQNRFDDDAP